MVLPWPAHNGAADSGVCPQPVWSACRVRAAAFVLLHTGTWERGNARTRILGHDHNPAVGSPGDLTNVGHGADSPGPQCRRQSVRDGTVERFHDPDHFLYRGG